MVVKVRNIFQMKKINWVECRKKYKMRKKALLKL